MLDFQHDSKFQFNFVSGLEVKIAVMLSSMKAVRAFIRPAILQIKNLGILRSTFAVLLASLEDCKTRYQNLSR